MDIHLRDCFKDFLTTVAAKREHIFCGDDAFLEAIFLELLRIKVTMDISRADKVLSLEISASLRQCQFYSQIIF